MGQIVLLSGPPGHRAAVVVAEVTLGAAVLVVRGGCAPVAGGVATVLEADPGSVATEELEVVGALAMPPLVKVVMG